MRGGPGVVTNGRTGVCLRSVLPSVSRSVVGTEPVRRTGKLRTVLRGYSFVDVRVFIFGIQFVPRSSISTLFRKGLPRLTG